MGRAGSVDFYLMVRDLPSTQGRRPSNTLSCGCISSSGGANYGAADAWCHLAVEVVFFDQEGPLVAPQTFKVQTILLKCKQPPLTTV